MAEPGARDRMIDGAAVLLAKRGLQGASFSEVLEATGAPRGSIYHHFPGGKDELVAAAIARVSERTLARLTELGGSATSLTEGFLGLWRALLDRSGLTAGLRGRRRQRRGVGRPPRPGRHRLPRLDGARRRVAGGGGSRTGAGLRRSPCSSSRPPRAPSSWLGRSATSPRSRAWRPR